MHIAQILLTRSFAGSERHAVELANRQCDRHHVTMLMRKAAAEDRPDAIAHRLDPRIEQVLLPGPGLLSHLLVRRWLARHRPDVAHAHLSWACRALKGMQSIVPLRVGTLHITYKPQQHGDLDALIAIAPWQLDAVPAQQRSRVRQINNWTQAGPFDAEARRRIRNEYGVGDSEILVGALGRTESSKGLDILVQSFQAIQPSGLRLAIVGGGRDWPKLRQLAGPDIIMPGFVPRPQDWFSAFDVFVSAARSEPFGLVFLEAMAAGLPIVATSTQGACALAPLIQRDLLPIDSSEAWNELFRVLAKVPPVRRAYDLSHYSVDRSVALIESFYVERMPAQA